jgi:hypothetical protein
MKPWQPTALALSLAAAFSGAAVAQSNADLLKEIQALKARVNELESAQQKAKPTAPQWGMTPEQASEFNRIAVKAEAMEDARDASGLKGLKISGFIDPTYIYNKGQNVATFQLLNKDYYSYDAGYFGMGLIDFYKETDDGTRWRLTLAPERGVGATFNTGSIVHEATVSIPVGDLQTRAWIGQIPDWSGYEYLPPTQNKLITHNLLFDFTLPTAYTGISTDITSGKWLYKVGLANVNSSRVNAATNGSGNKTPAVIYRVDYSRGEFQGFGFAGVHGNLYNYAADGTDEEGKNTRADLFEFDAYFIRGDLTWQGQISYGRQKKAAIAPDPDTGALRDASWWGLSTLAAFKFMPRWEVVGRLDYVNNAKNGGGLLGYSFDDGRNGIGRGFVYNPGDGETAPSWDIADPNKGSNRIALSVGLSYLYNLNTTFKAEYRMDRANQAVFNYLSDGSYKKTNHLLGTSVVVSF